VLQQLLVDITGKFLPALMQETVLSKLGMSNSTFDQPVTPSESVYAATGYDEQGAPVRGRWRVYPEMAPAGLWTTPSDLALFAIEILKSREGKANRSPPR
jgi:CubicO group peptidase (beta-lactamase class C family)